MWNKILLSLSLLCCVFGCSSKQQDPPETQDTKNSLVLPDDTPDKPAKDIDSVKYKWLRNGIQMEVYSTEELNIYNDVPHNLMVCLYQLSDNEVLNNIVNVAVGGDEDFREKLLSCEQFDKTIVNASRFFITPKQHNVLMYDREKDVKSILLVAGYDNSNISHILVQRDIPVLFREVGVIFKEEQYSSTYLKMRIFLGKHSIQDLRHGERFEDVENMMDVEPRAGDKMIEDIYMHSAPVVMDVIQH